ncbi:MAG: DNA polymerase IV [Kiritimatiellia bacterium]
MRVILHLDMDAFFAAIEQHDRPELRGKPVAIGAAPDRRGVVSTASYEARKFGIHSAMPSRTAYRLCPEAVFVEPRMSRYAEISSRVMAILNDFSPDMEPVSVDEAFLDLGGVLHFWPSAETLARKLKERIRTELGLTASVGIAPNKFLAKLGSDLNKPDGLTLVPTDPEAIVQFLAPLPVSRIFGVGEVTERALKKHGIKTIGQLQATPRAHLAALFGGLFADQLYSLARGLDDRPLVMEWEEKSISNETTFEEDCASRDILRQTLLELAEHVGRRLRRHGKLARTVQIKARFPDFRTITRQAALPEPTDTDRDLIRAGFTLYEKAGLQGPLRLLGFGVSNLMAPREGPVRQPLLFEEPRPERRKKDKQLDKAVDDLRNKFGEDILKRGGV